MEQTVVQQTMERQETLPETVARQMAMVVTQMAVQMEEVVRQTVVQTVMILARMVHPLEIRLQTVRQVVVLL